MCKRECTYKPIHAEDTEIFFLLLQEEQKRLAEKELQGFVAYWGHFPVGVLLYYKGKHMLRMHRIFVLEGHRRMGIATGMLEQLCRYADASGQELGFSFDGETIRDSFYRFVASTHIFYVERAEGFEAYLTKEQVAELCRKYADKKGKAIGYFETSKTLQAEFTEHLKQHYPAIAWELEKEQRRYRKDLCCCVAEKEKIQSVCLIKEQAGELELQFLYARPEKGVAAAMALLQSIASLDAEKAMPLRVSVVNAVSEKILNQLCMQYRITKRFYTARYIGKA